MGMISTIANVFGGAGVWGYAAVAVFAAGTAGYEAQHIRGNADLVKYQGLQLRDAKAVTSSLEAQAAALTAVAAQQHALDQEVSQGAVSEATAQQKITVHTVTITKEVPIYVTPQIDTVVVPCIPYGLVRVLDAAALATADNPVTPADLALPTGQSDDACTGIKASDLAASIAANYGIAKQNAEQLDALEAEVTKIITTGNQHD
jgi:hypothetical protein